MEKHGVSCSQLPLAGFCRASVSHREKYNSGSALSLMGEACHHVLECRLRNAPVNAEILQIRYGLTTKESDEALWLGNSVQLDFSAYDLLPEMELACDAAMKPCQRTDPQCVLAGRLDVVVRPKDNPTHAEAYDMKSGFLDVDESDANGQLRGQALLLFANFPELQTVKTAIFYPRQKRVSKPVEYNRLQAEELWPALATVSRECRVPEPRLAKGPWCRFCANKMCKAWTAEFTAALDTPGTELILKSGEMTADLVMDRLRQLLPKARMLESFIANIKEFAKLNTPLDLGNGEVYENRPQEQTVIDAVKALPVLRAECGTEAVDVALESISQEVVTILARGEAERAPRGAKKALLDKLEAAGAITKQEKDRYSIYYKEKIVTVADVKTVSPVATVAEVKSL